MVISQLISLFILNMQTLVMQGNIISIIRDYKSTNFFSWLFLALQIYFYTLLQSTNSHSGNKNIKRFISFLNISLFF